MIGQMPDNVISLLQSGQKISAVEIVKDAHCLTPKEALKLINLHVRCNLERYPPKVWPSEALRDTQPPSWCCQSGTMEILVEWGQGSCWELPTTNVDGVLVCAPCADRLAELAP